MPQRLGASSVVVVGIAGVVGVLVALLAMGAGFQATLKQTGTDDTAIVLRAGAQTELNSVLDHDSATMIGAEPQVARDAHGQPIASPELVVVASLPKKSTGLDANVEVRGVGERAWELRPKRQASSRAAGSSPGLRELIVGKGARSAVRGHRRWARVNSTASTWTVVGEFESGDAYDSELWADADVVASTYRRGSSSTSVTVRLNDADRRSMRSRPRSPADPRLKVDASTTRAYYTEQSASADAAHPRPRHDGGHRSWRSAPSSARSTPCMRRWPRARARSRLCGPSVFAAPRSSSRC